MEKEGVKHDQGKLPYHLVPYDALEQVVKVLEFGARKYGDRNWESGFDWHRGWSALIRHAVAWFRGEDLDAESGLSHLAHAGCCILFLLAYEIRKVGTDDRMHRRIGDNNGTRERDQENQVELQQTGGKGPHCGRPFWEEPD